MKYLITLFTLVMFAFTVNAQYIYNDFDANQNETFTSWPNPLTVIANPDVSGINTSANVAEVVRSEEQWANTYCDLPGKIDFSTGTDFNIKVWSPIACTILFKLEDKLNGSVSTELQTDITDVNQWVQLTFDFTDGQSGLYDKIVIFFDFTSTTDNTFYFDDVTGPEYGAGGTGTQVDLPVTFDDPEVTYALTDFGGNDSEIVVDPTDATNMVAQSLKSEGAETWAGTTVGGTTGFATPIPFAEGSTTMTVAVWSPTVGTPVRLKVEDAGDPTKSVETEATTTVSEAWETLEFDFSNEAEGTAEIDFSYTYNKASIFFNFGSNGTGLTYFWDDMYFYDPTGINNIKVETLNVYPNPATDNIYIKNSEKLSELSIYSVNGKMVYNTNNPSNTIDISNLTSGVYAIKATDISGKIYTNSLIIK